MKFQEALNCYLLENLNQIQSGYKWDFTTNKFPISYKKKSTNDYQNSLDLREFIHQKVKFKSEFSDEFQVWYVKEWGGVKSNKTLTFDDYLISSSEELINRGQKGVASWSKMLSVRDPSKYAIYDARVAVSLNTISLLFSEESNLFFPQLSSRNNKIIAAQQSIKKYIKLKNLNIINDFYNSYLYFLRKAVNDCERKFDIQTAEMILFANAEEMAKKWS